MIQSQQQIQNKSTAMSEKVSRVSFLLFEGSSDAFTFLPAHSLQHSESIRLHGNTLIICLCRLKQNTGVYEKHEL